MSNPNPQPHRYCSYCGTRFVQLGWPRHCRQCGQYTFRNPVPVAVVLLPVGAGLLVVRRGIEPGRGELCLPDGFLGLQETWQEAAARELFEETQVAIDPAQLQIYSLRSAPDGTLLIFCLAPPWEGELPPFTPSYETPERHVLLQPGPLAFLLHSEAVADYFARRDGRAG